MGVTYLYSLGVKTKKVMSQGVAVRSGHYVRSIMNEKLIGSKRGGVKKGRLLLLGRKVTQD